MTNLLASDDFQGSDGAALGSTPVGNLAWQAVTGTWTYSGGKAHTDTGYSDDPIVVVDAGVADVDVSADISPTGGDAVYLRCSGPGDWIRLRLYEYTTSSSHDVYRTETYYVVRAYRTCLDSSGSSGFTSAYNCGSCPDPNSTDCPNSCTYCGGPENPSCSEDGTCQVYDHTESTYYYNYYTILEKSVGGSVSQLASASLGTGRVTNLRLVGNGSSLTVYATYQGSEAAHGSYTSTVNQHVTKHGVGRGGPTDRDGSALDNFALGTFASAPARSTPTYPANGSYVDTSAGLRVDAPYHSTDNADANAIAIRIKDSNASGYSYWNAASGAWQSTVVWNAVSVADGETYSTHIPASSTTATGAHYNLGVAFQESLADLQGSFGPDVTFTAQAGPTLSLQGPSGTVTDTSRPTARWTTTPAQGSQQTTYRVVFEAGSYGTEPGQGTTVADSGTLNGSAQAWTCDTDLDDGTTYRCFVTVSQSGGQSSGWRYATFTMQLSPPAVPTITVSAGSDVDTGAPVASGQIAGGDGGTTFGPDNTTFDLQVSADGKTWRSVRGSFTPDADDTASWQDLEIPFAVETKYRARTVGMLGGNTIASAWSDPMPVTVESSTSWLADPTDPASSVKLALASEGKRTRPWPGGSQRVLDRPDEVVEYGVRGKAKGSFVARTRTDTELDRLDALLGRGKTLLLRMHPDQGQAGEALYLAVLPGDDATSAERLYQGPTPARTVAFSWTGKPRP